MGDVVTYEEFKALRDSKELEEQLSDCDNQPSLGEDNPLTTDGKLIDCLKGMGALSMFKYINALIKIAEETNEDRILVLESIYLNFVDLGMPPGMAEYTFDDAIARVWIRKESLNILHGIMSLSEHQV